MSVCYTISSKLCGKIKWMKRRVKFHSTTTNSTAQLTSTSSTIPWLCTRATYFLVAFSPTFIRFPIKYKAYRKRAKEREVKPLSKMKSDEVTIQVENEFQSQIKSLLYCICCNHVVFCSTELLKNWFSCLLIYTFYLSVLPIQQNTAVHFPQNFYMENQSIFVPHFL